MQRVLPPGLYDRFFNIGTNFYLDVNQTMLLADSVGKMLTAPMRIQWTSPDKQVNMWQAATTPAFSAQMLEVISFPEDALVPTNYFWLKFVRNV